MICSSENRFFTSNLLVRWDWTPNRPATQNRGDVATGLVCIDPLGLAFGVTDLVASPYVMAAGGATTILGAVGGEESMSAGLFVVALGLNQAHDGVSGIATAFDGVERPSGFERVGGAVLGGHGAEIGEFIGKFTNLSSALKSFRRVMSHNANAQDIYDTVRTTTEAGQQDSTPCECNGVEL